MAQESPKKILIVGGGFGGVRTALTLAKKSASWRSNAKIVLISNTPHFEYHAALYRIVAGHSPLEVCIPLAEIFKGKDVEIVEDTIIKVDLEEKTLKGSSKSHYTYDYLVLALGSETAYFDIPGMEELSFGFKTITEALRLKRHIHEMFSSCVIADDKAKECALKFVIVGGGASGTELACELALYTKQLAEKHTLDNRLVTIDLIDANDRLIKFLPQKLSDQIAKKVRKLGIQIHFNKRVIKKEIETVYLKDMKMRTKTVIWTAGVRPNHLYEKIAGIELDDSHRVVVDEYLQVKGEPNVFVIGDAAASQYSGMAQTADDQGAYVGEFISNKLKGEKSTPYTPKQPFYAIPIGEDWGLFYNNSVYFSGTLGWWLRKLADLRFYLSILPFSQALSAFRSDTILWESCSVCSSEQKRIAYSV